MNLSIAKVHRLYSLFKYKGRRAFSRDNYNMSLNYMRAAAATAYSFYFELVDEDIEKLLLDISSHIQKKETNSEVLPNRCVFYDSHSLSYGGLTLQYVRSIIEIGWELLYITESSPNSGTFRGISQELEGKKNVRIVYVPQIMRLMDKAQYIYEVIMGFMPQTLFMHYAPTAVHASVAFHALPSVINRYLIDFTDHTFWPGRDSLDYILEFRVYGCNLSVNKREIPQDNVFLLPFYPIENNFPFEGFPFKQDGKIVIFSGGAYYKTIDSENTFFKICKGLVEIHPNVMIAYAGMGDKSLMTEKIQQFGLEGRFFILGQRKDISSIYDHCDIYLNTYPVGGGLMCQYAAHHAIPILSLHDDTKSDAEEFVCQKGFVEISSPDITCLLEKAKQLILDKDYRQKQGKTVYDQCITERVFRDALVMAVEKKKNLIPWVFKKEFNPHVYDVIGKIQDVNKTKSYHVQLTKVLGWRTFFISPIILIDALFSLIRQGRLFIAITNRFKR